LTSAEDARGAAAAELADTRAQRSSRGVMDRVHKLEDIVTTLEESVFSPETTTPTRSGRQAFHVGAAPSTESTPFHGPQFETPPSYAPYRDYRDLAHSFARLRDISWDEPTDPSGMSRIG